MSKSSSSATAAPPGAFGFFTNRKISTKISIGFGCILIITGLISAISYVEFGKIDRDFNDYSRKVTNGAVIADIDRQFLAFRRYAGEVSENIEENFKAADKTRKIVRERLDQALKGIKDTERAAKVKHMSDQFEIYSKDFDKVVPMQREQVKFLIARIREAPVAASNHI